MSRGKSKRRAARKLKESQEAFGDEIGSLTDQINANQNITPETRAELLASISGVDVSATEIEEGERDISFGSGGGTTRVKTRKKIGSKAELKEFADIKSLLKRADSGEDPLFKSRQAGAAKQKNLLEAPGSGQTLLSR